MAEGCTEDGSETLKQDIEELAILIDKIQTYDTDKSMVVIMLNAAYELACIHWYLADDLVWVIMKFSAMHSYDADWVQVYTKARDILLPSERDM